MGHKIFFISLHLWDINFFISLVKHESKNGHTRIKEKRVGSGWGRWGEECGH